MSTHITDGNVITIEGRRYVEYETCARIERLLNNATTASLELAGKIAELKRAAEHLAEAPQPIKPSDCIVTVDVLVAAYRGRYLSELRYPWCAKDGNGYWHAYTHQPVVSPNTSSWYLRFDADCQWRVSGHYRHLGMIPALADVAWDKSLTHMKALRQP